MFYNLCYIFLQFMFFSIIGYLAEITHVSLLTKKVTFSRGFLIGPYLPIYGFSSVVMIFLLSHYEDDLFTLFVMSAFICTLLEYLTSLILEKIFKLRWWDYSNKKFNIEGRVCLANSLLFGLGGLIVVKVLNPILDNYLKLLDSTTLEVIAIVIFIIFLADFILSLLVLVRLEINVNKFIKKDATSEIKKEIALSLQKYTNLTIRLIKSFPTIKSPNSKAFNAFKNSLLKTKEELNRLKTEVKEKVKKGVNDAEKIKKLEDKM